MYLCVALLSVRSKEGVEFGHILDFKEREEKCDLASVKFFQIRRQSSILRLRQTVSSLAHSEELARCISSHYHIDGGTNGNVIPYRS